MFRYLLLTSILATCNSWVLTSTHTNIIPQLTDDVTLQCSYKDTGDVIQTMEEVARIRLLKLNNKKEWNEYAEIIFPNTSLAKVIGPNEPGVLASGYLGRVSESYLSMTWSTSSEETVGSYKCEIDGFALDNGNDIHIITGSVNLTQEDVTMKDLLDLIVQMRKKSDRLSQEITSLKRGKLIHNKSFSRNIKRQVQNDIVNSNCYFDLRNWPAGKFSMLETDDGCPETFSSKFKSGFVQFETETIRRPWHNFTSARNLTGDVFERYGRRNVVTLGLCTADIKEPRTLWPAGSYCVSYAEPSCPSGFHLGYTTLYPKTSKSIIATDFADAIYFNNELINFHYCCRSDGSPETPILLPNTKPFYLYRYKGRCQNVQGLEVQEQMFTIETDATKTDKFSNSFHPDSTLNDLTVHLCYYYVQ